MFSNRSSHALRRLLGPLAPCGSRRPPSSTVSLTFDSPEIYRMHGSYLSVGLERLLGNFFLSNDFAHMRLLTAIPGSLQ